MPVDWHNSVYDQTSPPLTSSLPQTFLCCCFLLLPLQLSAATGYFAFEFAFASASAAATAIQLVLVLVLVLLLLLLLLLLLSLLLLLQHLYFLAQSVLLQATATGVILLLVQVPEDVTTECRFMPWEESLDAWPRS